MKTQYSFPKVRKIFVIMLKGIHNKKTRTGKVMKKEANSGELFARLTTVFDPVFTRLRAVGPGLATATKHSIQQVKTILSKTIDQTEYAAIILAGNDADRRQRQCVEP